MRNYHNHIVLTDHLNLKEEYGEKAKGNVSYSKIKVDISAERSKEKNNNEGNTIDLQI